MQRKNRWKLAVCILTVLLASIVFFQWKSFLTHNRELQQKAKVDISIKHQNNFFSIQQTIHHINPEIYNVILPNNINKLKCTEGSNKKCKWLDKNKLKISSNSVTFTYQIKKEKSKNGLLLLSNWFIQLNNLNLDKVDIQLSESQLQNGSWISGGKSIAVKQLKFIDYYVFESNEKYPSLLWTNHKLLKVSVNDWLTIYRDESVSIPEFHFNQIEKWKTLLPVSLYITKDKPTQQIGSLILLNIKDVSNLEPMIVQSYLNDQFPETKGWIRDIIASSIVRFPLGNNKVKTMYNQLANILDDKEIDKWISDVLNIKKEQIQEKDLDDILQKVTGMGTNYFQENRHDEEPLKSLHFYDPHIVIVDDQVKNNIKIILLNGKRMYPLEKTLTALGYTVKFSTKSSKIEIERPNQKYIFDKNSHIFYFNNEKYGVLSQPIIIMNQQYFIEENWLKQLFKVNISKRNKQIKLTESKQ
ncbi:MAG: stalk domain-containing protein [Heyndrickxia sp.]